MNTEKIHEVTNIHVARINSICEMHKDICNIINLKKEAAVEKALKANVGEINEISENINKYVKSGLDKNLLKSFSRQALDAALAVAEGAIHMRAYGEMVHVHLVILSEEYIKSLLKALLLLSPNHLMMDNKVSYKDIIKFEAMDDLRESLADKFIYEVGHGGLYDYEKVYKNRFNIIFSKFNKWSNIQETYLRRNLIVHNKANIDEAYRRIAGCAGTQSHIVTDLEYNSRVMALYINFAGFLKDEAIEKFKK